MFDSFKRITDVPVERRKLQCHNCHQNSIHTLEAKCSGLASEYVGHGVEIDWGDDFLIYRCGNCDAISFMISSWFSEDMEQDEYGRGILPRSEKQYPTPTSSEFTFNTEFIPDLLKALLDEMLFTLVGGKLRLATIALRMTIEFIVKDTKCKGRDLSLKIKDLRSRDLIDDDQEELLQKIRQKGNASAHEAKPMAKDELVAAMGVIELLLEAFYNSSGRKARVIALARGAFAEPTNPKSLKLEDDPVPF